MPVYTACYIAIEKQFGDGLIFTTYALDWTLAGKDNRSQHMEIFSQRQVPGGGREVKTTRWGVNPQGYRLHKYNLSRTYPLLSERLGHISYQLRQQIGIYSTIVYIGWGSTKSYRGSI